MKALRIFKIKPLLLGLTVSFFVLGFTKCSSKNVEERNLQSKAKAEAAYSKERKKIRWYSECGRYRIYNKNGERVEFFRATYLCAVYCNAKNKIFPDRRVSSPVSPFLKVRLYSKSGEIIYEDTLKKHIASTDPVPIDYEDPNLDVSFALEGTVKLPKYEGTNEKYTYRIVRLDKNNKEIVLHEQNIWTSEYLEGKSFYGFDEENECLSESNSGPALY